MLVLYGLCPLFSVLCCFIVFPLQLCLGRYYFMTFYLFTYLFTSFWGPLIGFICRHVFTSYSLISKIPFCILYFCFVLFFIAFGSCTLKRWFLSSVIPYYFSLQTMAFLNLIFIACALPDTVAGAWRRHFVFFCPSTSPSTGKYTKKSA